MVDVFDLRSSTEGMYCFAVIALPEFSSGMYLWFQLEMQVLTFDR